MVKRSILIIICICLITKASIITTGIIEPPSFRKHFTLKDQDIQNHDPIHIINDDDLITQATDENWDLNGTRDGSLSKPYIISNYSITGHNERLIWIEVTTLHLTIENNQLFNGGHGISLWNTNNIIISNNIISNNTNSGIDLQGYNTTISNNVIENCNTGIQLYGRMNAKIIDNEILRNSGRGITIENFNMVLIIRNDIYENGEGLEFLMYTRNTLVYDNDIHNNYQCGVFLGDNFHVNITNNRIHHNSRNGIQYEFSFENSTINNNWIFDNGISGIVILWAANFKIINNTINRHNQFGIVAELDVSNLTISGNFVSNCENYGISFTDTTVNNNVSYNNFVNNSLTLTSQGLDSGIRNNITNNYWNNWIEPDDNSDNIVDIPYRIDGTANNSDPYPLCYPTNATIASPTTNATIPSNTTDNTESSQTEIIPYLTTWFILPDLCLFAFIFYFIRRKQFKQAEIV